LTAHFIFLPYTKLVFMKRILVLTACAATFVIFGCNNDDKKTQDKTASAFETKSDETKSESYTFPDEATKNQRYQDYMTLGEAHKMMAKGVGTWASDMTWWETPGGQPMKTSGTMTTRMIMQGHYQVSDYTGDMGGMAFEGISTTGYDNIKKVYTSTWIDNMGTGIMKVEGPWDEATKSVTMKGKMVDALANKEISVRETYKWADDNTQVFEMYKSGPDGKEYKCMEAKYTRKK
jgi:hypothetical protein